MSYYAEQTGRYDVGIVGAWTDVPGASLTFQTIAPTNKLSLQANGAISALGGTSSWIRCGFRFLIDGLPGNPPSSPIFGDLLISPAKLESGPGEWLPYFVARRTTVAAGTHVVKLQVTHAYTQYATTDGTCSGDQDSYSKARLVVTVLP